MRSSCTADKFLFLPVFQGGVGARAAVPKREIPCRQGFEVHEMTSDLCFFGFGILIMILYGLIVSS